MPPNQVIPPQGPAAGSAPQVVESIVPPQPSSGKPYKKIVIILAVVVALAALGGGAYAFNQKRTTTKKFNQLAADIKKQELDGLSRYTKAASITNDFGNMINLATGDNPPADIAQQLSGKVSTLRDAVNTSCSAKDSDLTASIIDTRVKGLRLDADQQKYVSDMKDVIGGLQNTEYSNVGMCASGPAFVSFADNFAKLMPAHHMFIFSDPIKSYDCVIQRIANQSHDGS